MKFTHVKFSEEKELRLGSEVKEVNTEKLYEVPLSQAEKMAQGEPAYEDRAGEYEVSEEDIADTVGKEVDESKYFQEKEAEEEVSEEVKFLEERTVSEVQESVKEIEDADRLRGILEVAERKGAQEALEQRIAQLDSAEDQDSEDEEQE